MREKKNVNLQKIRFNASFKPKILKPLLNSNLSLRLFESMYETRKQVLDIKETAGLDEKSGVFKFPSVQFTTDILEDGPVVNKTMILQIIERYTEIDKKTKEFIKKEKFYGEVQVKLRDMFEKG